MWFAAAVKRDRGNARAKAILQRAGELVTTDHVLIETWFLLGSRSGRNLAERFWDGVRRGAVAVFDLADHPKAARAYAWSYELPDGKGRFFAVLHMGGITGPRGAVRAAIVAEASAK